MHMRDSEVVASIVAGDPDGLAAAYDRYADPLYKYCQTLLRDPADTAAAVQDTFVIAAARLDCLRQPDRLRAWLYAVARKESLGIARAKRGPSALDEALPMTGEGAEVSAAAEHGELRRLLDDAEAGLNTGEREIIELQLRLGLKSAEVASVLGVSRSHAHALFSRARDQLEICLAVLLVCRGDCGDCGELGSLLTGWDGRLTAVLRKRVHRHIERCPICSARRASELRPSMLLGLSPGAALAAGAAASFRLAAGVPEGLKAHTIALATGHEASAEAHRAAVLSHAGAFTRYGFPKPVHGGGADGKRRAPRSWPQGQAAVAATVVLAVLIATAAFALTGGSESFRPAADPKPSLSVAVTASASPAATPTKAGPTAAAATRTASTTAAGSATATASPAPTLTPTQAQSPSASPSVPSPSSSAPGPSTGPTRQGPPPVPSPSPSPVPPGTLIMAPGGGLLIVPPGGAAIDLVGVSGPVTWSATITNDPGSAVSVSASAGTLTPAGPGTSVTVIASQFLPCLSSSYPTITINPGGAQYFVCTGWIKPGHGHGRGHEHGHGHGNALASLIATTAPPAGPSVP